MAGVCYGVVGEDEVSTEVQPRARKVRRRGLEIHHLKYVSGVVLPVGDTRKRSEIVCRDLLMFPLDFENAGEVLRSKAQESGETEEGTRAMVIQYEGQCVAKFGMTSICGRRRDMEDAVDIQPSFFVRRVGSLASRFHFYGVYDGHGCSHVALRCKYRLKDLVKEEIDRYGEIDWEKSLKTSFLRMDREVLEGSSSGGTECSGAGSGLNCRCGMQAPRCEAVGSTALVAVVTPEKIVISNCGDSRAVLCRNGVAVPLSVDHKPDRPDELERIHEAGGRVIYWDIPRVVGVLAMSRAIGKRKSLGTPPLKTSRVLPPSGDEYLKPYVIAEPEVTVTGVTEEDECLILATDGLWDVVDNETACSVARMCFRGRKPSPPLDESVSVGDSTESSDKVCSEASMLLTRLALARNSSDNVTVVVIDLRKANR